MAMRSADRHGWTLEEVERGIAERPGHLPRLELVDGALLVTPAPSNRHQRIIGTLYIPLARYVAAESLGEVLPGPCAVRLEPESYVEPDLIVVPAVDGKRQRSDLSVTSLLLAVEILSASSARHDRITKRKLFQRAAVPNYWIVDGESETFEIWRPGDDRPTIVDELLVWEPEGATAPFALDVRAFFLDVADRE
jgi:Uma2 family endonuclease